MHLKNFMKLTLRSTSIFMNNIQDCLKFSTILLCTQVGTVVQMKPQQTNKYLFNVTYV